MKLDYDCLRYILLEIENSNKSRILASSLANDNYSEKQIIHHIECLKDVSYIETTKPFNSLSSEYSDYFIFRLTMQGHQFLDTIRDSRVWSETKKIASKMASVPLKFLSDIASNVLSDIISKQMGISN